VIGITVISQISTFCRRLQKRKLFPVSEKPARRICQS